MTDYHVGMKVACVCDSWIIDPRFPQINVPKRGGSYIIRTIEDGDCGLAFRFHWLINVKYPYYPTREPGEAQFSLREADGRVNFVPIVERESKTDIAVLKKLLVPGTKVLETVD